MTADSPSQAMILYYMSIGLLIGVYIGWLFSKYYIESWRLWSQIYEKPIRACAMYGGAISGALGIVAMSCGIMGMASVLVDPLLAFLLKMACDVRDLFDLHRAVT